MILRIFAERDRDVAVAYRHVGESQWRDPYGGFFPDDEQKSFDAFTTGRRPTVMVNGRELRARLTFSEDK